MPYLASVLLCGPASGPSPRVQRVAMWTTAQHEIAVVETYCITFVSLLSRHAMQKRQSPSFLASLFGRSSRNISTPTKRIDTSALRPFQAISINPGAPCCTSAKKVDKYRFLAKNAPQLPLSECTMRATCKCRYAKQDDRRSGTRRDGEFGLKSALFSAEERRRSKGRRKDD